MVACLPFRSSFDTLAKLRWVSDDEERQICTRALGGTELEILLARAADGSRRDDDSHTITGQVIVR